MRSKRPSLDIDAELLELDLGVVVQQLQPRVLRDTQPYDAGPPKVRERADPAKRHHELPVTTSDPGGGRLEVIDAIVRLLAEKFERQVQP